MNVIVHDNWLNPVYFNVLKEYILSTEFAWYKGEVVEDVGQVAPIKTQPIFEKRDQFFHAFINDKGENNSGGVALIHKIGWFLNAKKIIRAKLNYGSKTNEPQLGGWHVDYDYKVNPNDSDYKIAILYINTNNGYTLLENGQEILSVENRVVIFDNSVLHTDCSQTDIQGRIVLNIVYCE
jgi:hypothetical protein|tara:strand:+ start:1311 stop:1850 length:540 start_codon:yes stop_codon:yes gene_type:complete